MADEYFFIVKDPRGRTVTCTTSCWKSHVIANHPDMEGWEEDVQQAIKKPHMGIYADRYEEDKHIYYGEIRHTRRLMLKVIIHFPADAQEGELVTAFPASNKPKGEKLIWPSSNP